MSRILMAASTRLFRGMRADQMFLNNTRQLAAKKPPPPPPKPTKSAKPAKLPPKNKAATTPNCPPTEEKAKKPKPGFFPSGGTHAVFSDLPMPEGDFVKEWKAKNAKYNMILLSGIVALIGSLFLGISSGVMQLYCFVPEYPYTEEELEKFEDEEIRKVEEKKAREERHKEALEAKELNVRRRKAKEAMAREVELMQKDIDEGISDKELLELHDLVTSREEFEKWEAEEEKRLKEVAKQKEEEKKEQEKLQKEKDKQKEKLEKEKEKEAKKKKN